ncbi:MAG: ABC-2 type transport system ATP-binding protein [Planctomycetota bacterium]
MIEISNLTKQFQELVAVDHLSLTADSGTIYGLLGPNGAGKSTTISCISGLLVPTSGSVRIQGFDIVSDAKKAKASLGVVPQELALYEELSARENISFWAGIHGMRGNAMRSRTDEVLQEVGLYDRSKEPVKNFSGGMKRRLNFACGIAHRPKVLLCDEPTVGVDPQSRVRLLELVEAQRFAGTTVIYTTHYMEEAEDLCDHLGIVDQGKIIADGNLAELRELMGERDLVNFTGTFPIETTREALALQGDVEQLALDEDQLQISLQNAPARLAELMGLLATAGARIQETSVRQPSLESLFIKLTGKELRE